jgi:hypothetical protein
MDSGEVNFGFLAAEGDLEGTLNALCLDAMISLPI